MLAKLLEERFSQSQRRRGYDLFHDADIILGGFDGNKVNISIDCATDSELLMIRRLSNRQIFSHCPCSTFSKHKTCQHLWAAILAIDEHQRNDLTKFLLESFGVRPPPDWKNVLFKIKRTQEANQFHSKSRSTPKKSTIEILYLIDLAKPYLHGQTGLSLSVLQGIRTGPNQWKKLRRADVTRELINQVDTSIDQKTLRLLRGASDFFSDSDSDQFELERHWDPELIGELIHSGRLCWSPTTIRTSANPIPITKGFFNQASIGVNVTETDGPGSPATFDAFIRCLTSENGSSEILSNDSIKALAPDGTVMTSDALYVVNNPDAVPIWHGCQKAPDTEVHVSERETFLEKLSTLAGIEDIHLPSSWQVTEQTSIIPTGELRLKKNDYQSYFFAEIFVAYQDVKYHYTDQRANTYDPQTKRWLRRDKQSEIKLLDVIENLPIAYEKGNAIVSWDLKFHQEGLREFLDYFAQHNWDVLLEGHKFHAPKSISIEVKSEQDWFDVSTKIEFEGHSIALPELLANIKANQYFVTLADGSRGKLPDEIIARYTGLAYLGKQVDNGLRFQSNQAAILDALLDSQPNVKFDQTFQTTRKKLSQFKGIKPKTPPKGFCGTLRKYQKEGLGWLHFLRQYGFGGCLADDMGLGKTVQVLSLLESRRTRRNVSDQSLLISPELSSGSGQGDEKNKGVTNSRVLTDLTKAVSQCKKRPSIVVVPKSLIFNWIQEAEKFTPRLRLVNYTGTDRRQRIKKTAGFDLLITTYGTLRKDIQELSQVHFDYAILDESQAIKNASAQVAKASQLIRADHRLAMTGTPVENHLGELWSLFEFLNPGMLGVSSKFDQLTRMNKVGDREKKVVTKTLTKTIQPFVLRRNKEQVLKDLPAKTEQTLFCDMLPGQRKKYDELKHYYQVKLKKKVETEGIGKTKIHVLEALLRLRQAACDPRLLDQDAKPGAKLELVQQQIESVVAEGHKVLVFSQFTSFLSLIRERFDAAGIKYEYLDGKTNDRQSPVTRFQNDKFVSAFLISLKAGGHGLNLTAADYVYLMDPWWNPAVEAQAIDRAHRMGQTRPVIAYRVICRDTVEEKIVELQKSKRELAQSIIQADGSMLKNLTVSDIQLLLN